MHTSCMAIGCLILNLFKILLLSFVIKINLTLSLSLFAIINYKWVEGNAMC